MSKKSNLKRCAVAVAATMLWAGAAYAGPRIEFGDDGGFLQIDVKGQIYLENTSYGGGSKGDENRTDLHFMRNRISLTGMIDDTWGYKFQTCGNTGTSKNTLGYALAAQDTDGNDRDVRIIDAYAIANFNEHLNLKVGLTKIPLTRANLDDCFAPLSQDRSMFVYSAYGTSPAKFARDLGGVATGRFFNDRLTYFAGIFQGREGSSSVQNPLDGRTYTSTNAPKTNLEYVGRLTWDFMDSEGGSGYQGTYFGEKNVLNIGFGMAYQPNAVYKNVSYNAITGASTITNGDTADYKAYAVDLMYEQKLPFGVVTATGQYLKTDFEDAWKTNNNPGDHLAVVAGMNGQKEGGYGKAAYILPITVGKAGKIQPYGLYEYWEFARLLGKNNQIINQYGGGLNYYILGDQRVRLTAEYLKTAFNQATPLPVGGVPSTMGAAPNTYKDFDTFRMMLQVVF
jgi:hypothetical protein